MRGFNFKSPSARSRTIEIVTVVPNNAAPKIDPIAKLIPSSSSPPFNDEAIETKTSGAPFLILIKFKIP